MSDDQKKSTFKILLIDDEPNNLEMMGRLLSHDYRIFVASNGKIGFSLAFSQQPDLILLDVMLSDINGYEMCLQLKADPITKDIPIIFVTSLSETSYENRGFEVGGVDYVVKPINPVILRARVKTHLDLKYKTDLLRQLATQDGLTGIANRRRFDEFLEQEWRRCVRGGTIPLSLILIDIDYFKNYNDFYQHLAGDQCLRQVASALQQSLERATDLAARYGGEEFCCILPDTTQKGALYIAEKIQTNIADMAIPHEKSEVAKTITVSMGVATCFPKKNENPSDLILAADTQLYLAKQAGRNRFCTEMS